MAEYARAGTPFEWTIYGAPTGKVGIATAKIKDGQGGLVAAASTAGIVEEEPGAYTVTRTAPAALGEYTLYFLPMPGGVTVAEKLVVNATGTPAPVPATDSYPDVDELLAASSCAELIALDDDQAEALRLEAIVGVESYAGQSFLPEGTEEAPVSRFLDGSGGRALELPKRLEVLTEVLVDGAVLGDVVHLSDSHDRLTLPRNGGVAGYYETALEIPMSRSFGSGPDAVEVRGVWGWLTVPDAVAMALRLHMEDRAMADANALAPSIRSYRGLGVSGIRQGNLSAQLEAFEPELSARARRQLADYVWTSSGGFSV